MNPMPDHGRVFPLNGGSAERTALRAPRLFASVATPPVAVMGNRAFMRSWAARRVAVRVAAETARAAKAALNSP